MSVSKRFFCALCAVLFVAALPCYGRRTQKAVRSERQATERRISKTQKQLTANEADTRRQLLELQALEGEIKVRKTREQQLSARSNELRRLSRKIADSIEIKQQRLNALRQSYANALRAARNQRKSASETTFLFSSNSFRQARSRVRWLKELSRWQTNKAEEINNTVAELSAERERLDSLDAALALSLDSLASERKILSQKKNRADAVVVMLKRQGKNLRRVLEEQKRMAAQLDRELNRIIEQEAREAAEAARREAERKRREQQSQQGQNGQQVQPGAPETPAAPVISPKGSFKDNKGKLPWPLDRKAVISSTFGRHTHDTYSRVELQNNGIDFDTEPGASARAVFDGVVTAVVVMEGFGNVVLVRHGDYLTVYAGLSELRIRKGQAVAAGQLLGTILSDPSDNRRTRLHFEVRREKDKLDPQQWLHP